MNQEINQSASVSQHADEAEVINAAPRPDADTHKVSDAETSLSAVVPETKENATTPSVDDEAASATAPAAEGAAIADDAGLQVKAAPSPDAAPCDTNEDENASSVAASEPQQDAAATEVTTQPDAAFATTNESVNPTTVPQDNRQAEIIQAAVSGHLAAGAATTDDANSQVKAIPSPETATDNGSDSKIAPAVVVSKQDAAATVATAEPGEAPAASSAPASAETTVKKREPRGASPKHDRVWPRRHTFCMMAAIPDVKFGGYQKARAAKPELKEVPGMVLALCPWTLKLSYLNLEDSAGVKKHGLEKYFTTWAANRLYYMFRQDERCEHPAERRDVGKVYREFFDAFSEDIAAGTPITEERAKAFWISVADRVPFHAPASAAPCLTATEAAVAGPTTEGIVATGEVSHE